MRLVAAIKLRWQTASLRGANSAGTYVADGMERQEGATLETRGGKVLFGHLGFTMPRHEDFVRSQASPCTFSSSVLKTLPNGVGSVIQVRLLFAK